MSPTYSSNAQLLISKFALRSNLQLYRSMLDTNTKILLMVKTNAYGTDSNLVASAVDHMVDYFGTAYSSNAYLLKDIGIKSPIMVLASAPADLEKIAAYKLEPVVYSLEMIKAAINLNTPLNVHIEIDSGMKRLGIRKEEIQSAIHLLNHSKLKVISAFSHLVASSEMEHDEFSQYQSRYFEECFEKLTEALPTKPLKHLVSSGGVKRFPQYHFDMVRMGIGFYGFDPTQLVQNEVASMATFQTKILQILEVKKGETIGYSRNGSLPYDAKIATLSVGYGDGYLRVFGNGNSEVFINGKHAKTVGNICMDLTSIDVTDIDCDLGDVVELFGSNITIDEMAKNAKTIPYEILTNISPRVERLLVE